MHFVAIVASERKNGNCDLLGQLAVRYALKLGADTSELVYLKDFRIEQCQGCLECVFKRNHCKLDDDLYKVLKIIKDADTLLLIAPTYVLSIPGKLKTLIDRFLSVYNYFKNEHNRAAVSIGVAALCDWHQFQLPLMNTFLLSLSRCVIDSFMLYGAGQGEALLNDGDNKLKKTIEKLVNYKETPYKSQVSNYCPIDFCTVFEHIENDKYRCPVCLTPAYVRKDGFYFYAEDLNNHRWSEERVKDHFINWILKTKPRFKELLPEIYKKKKEYGLI